MPTTPQNIDTYSRYMVPLFDDRDYISIPTAFQAFFGRPESASRTVFSEDAGTVDIDIMRGNEKIAALIPRGINAKILNRANTRIQNFTNFSRVFPLAEEEGDITSSELLTRMAGENPYERRTRMERLRERAMEQHLEHVRREGRLFEVLAAQSILEGTQDAILGTSNPDLIYDFRRLATHIVTLGTPWTGAADIDDDIDTACELIRADGLVEPDFMGLGGGPMKALIEDTDMQAKADNRRYELIKISKDFPVPDRFARYVAAGWTPRGMLQTSKGYQLWMFTNINVYTNSSGNPVKYMPDTQVFFGSTQARADRYFGPSDTLPLRPSEIAWYQETFGFSPIAAPMPRIDGGSSIITPQMFHFDAYPSNNRKSLTIRTQAAPIFATTMTDAFVTYKSVTT